MRVVGVLIAVTALACNAQAQVSRHEPACRAEHNGEELVTRIVFPDGYTVEAPWHVTARASAGRSATITAVLDHIIETRPLSRSRLLTELPGRIQMTFHGQTMGDLLSEAAEVWCSTVMHSRSPRFEPSVEPPPSNQIT